MDKLIVYIFCGLVVMMGLMGIEEGKRESFLYLIGFFVFFILPLMVAPIRKAIGLVNIILGVIFSVSGTGMVIGIPMMFFGAILLFIGGGKDVPFPPDMAPDSNVNYIDPEDNEYSPQSQQPLQSF